jgi:hypothetical protein
MINHRLFASTHHFDATLETVPSKAVTVARDRLRDPLTAGALDRTGAKVSTLKSRRFR